MLFDKWVYYLPTKRTQKLGVRYSKMKEGVHSLLALLSSSKKKLLIVILVALATLVVSVGVSMMMKHVHHLSFPSIGSIRTIGVRAYWDGNLREEITQIDWGTVYPGYKADVTLYMHSISNVVTTLQVDTANWTFRDSTDMIVSGPNSTSPYMDLSLDYDENIMQPNQTIQGTLTLLVSPSADFVVYLVQNEINSFSFDTVITAVELSEPAKN